MGDKKEIIERLKKIIEESNDNISLDTIMLAIKLIITNRPRKSLACMEMEKQIASGKNPVDTL